MSVGEKAKRLGKNTKRVKRGSLPPRWLSSDQRTQPSAQLVPQRVRLVHCSLPSNALEGRKKDNVFSRSHHNASFMALHVTTPCVVPDATRDASCVKPPCEAHSAWKLSVRNLCHKTPHLNSNFISLVSSHLPQCIHRSCKFLTKFRRFRVFCGRLGDPFLRLGLKCLGSKKRLSFRVRCARVFPAVIRQNEHS